MQPPSQVQAARGRQSQRQPPTSRQHAHAFDADVGGGSAFDMHDGSENWGDAHASEDDAGWSDKPASPPPLRLEVDNTFVHRDQTMLQSNFIHALQAFQGGDAEAGGSAAVAELESPKRHVPGRPTMAAQGSRCTEPLSTHCMHRQCRLIRLLLGCGSCSDGLGAAREAKLSQDLLRKYRETN